MSTQSPFGHWISSNLQDTSNSPTLLLPEKKRVKHMRTTSPDHVMHCLALVKHYKKQLYQILDNFLHQKNLDNLVSCHICNVG